jgi:hypothetical protein
MVLPMICNFEKRSCGKTLELFPVLLDPPAVDEEGRRNPFLLKVVGYFPVEAHTSGAATGIEGESDDFFISFNVGFNT